MKQTTKGILGIAAASILAIGAASGVFAGPGYGPAWGGHQGMMGGPGGMMGGPGSMHGPFGSPGWMGHGGSTYTAPQLDQLKATLGITQAQEQAWKAYADAITQRNEVMASHHDAWRGRTATPDQAVSFHEEGLEQMRKVADATRNLYAVLTPEQQARTGSLLAAGNCQLR